MPSVKFWKKKKKKKTYLMQQPSEFVPLLWPKKFEKLLLPPSWLPEEEVWNSCSNDMKAVCVFAHNSSSSGQPSFIV